MYGIIYMTTNLVDGRKYVGQHKCKNANDNYLGSGTILKLAIKQYGRENFIRQTLCVCDSKEELDQKEIEWIAKYNATTDPSFYNMQEGGSVNSMPGELNPMYGMKGELSPAYGRKKSEEEREILRKRMSGQSNPMYGHVYTSEERQRIGDGQRGEKHWNYGKHWNEETKRKMSESHKGINLGVKRGPMPEETKAKLSKAKKGRTPNFSEEGLRKIGEATSKRNQTEKFKQQVSDANKRLHDQGYRRGGKAVICIETGVVYASGYDACRAVGCSNGLVSSCLRGCLKTAKGFHWRFATEEETKRAVVV